MFFAITEKMFIIYDAKVEEHFFSDRKKHFEKNRFCAHISENINISRKTMFFAITEKMFIIYDAKVEEHFFSDRKKHRFS